MLTFANWPFYIDQDSSSPPRFPTLEAFTRKYGTKVTYREAVTDDKSFVDGISPALDGGTDTGWDLVVLTDWMVARLVRLGWVETIAPATRPTSRPTRSTRSRLPPGTLTTTSARRGSRA